MSFSSANEKIGRYRWTICTLVFAATTINYLDRNVLGLLKPILSQEGVFGDNKASQELNYANVVICFQIAYALGLLIAGRIIDKVGTKSGYAYSLIGWSLAAVGHAFGHHTWSFGLWRAALGVTEAGNFPAANKTIAEWFPKKERAFATGLYNSGANIGAVVAPLVVPPIANAWGWEWAFIITGVVGFTWLFFWYKMYSSPAEKLQAGQLSQAEYDFIHSDVDEQVANADAGGKVPMFEGFFSFQGRVRRGTFLANTLAAAVVSLFMELVVFMTITGFLAKASSWFWPFTAVVFATRILVAWPALAATAKRWRDIGQTGWLAILMLVPFLNLLVYLFLALKKGSDAENRQGPAPAPTLFDYRQTWAFASGKFLTDPIWWFFLFWLPAFLEGENARKVAAYAAANPDFSGDKSTVPGIIVWPVAIALIYTISTFGSVIGGWLPKHFINNGMTANKARKLTMFLIALLPMSVLFASRLGEINTWLAVAAIAIACAGHQAWSANIFTTVSDMFPKRAVGSVTGVGGMAGAIGGILIARAAGLLLAHYTELGKVEVAYGILFVICGCAYITAWVVMHLLVPRFKTVVL